MAYCEILVVLIVVVKAFLFWSNQSLFSPLCSFWVCFYFCHLDHRLQRCSAAHSTAVRARAVARARPLSAQVVQAQVQVVCKPSAVLCSSPQCTATNSALTMYLDPLHSALILPISVRSWTTIGAVATEILKRWDNHL